MTWEEVTGRTIVPGNNFRPGGTTSTTISGWDGVVAYAKGLSDLTFITCQDVWYNTTINTNRLTATCSDVSFAYEGFA